MGGGNDCLIKKILVKIAATPISYYNLSNVCLFVCLFVPLLLPGPWADLHQTWRESGGRPRILALGVHFLKGQGHRGQRSNLCCFFSVCSPTSPGPWADLHQTWWEG